MKECYGWLGIATKLMREISRFYLFIYLFGERSAALEQQPRQNTHRHYSALFTVTADYTC